MLQFQRFRVFHPLPKQAHHGILKTLWDKRVQWNQGLNARRTKQLLQAFLDQDVRLGIPSQALPLPATAPRPAPSAVHAPSASSTAAAAASAPSTAAAPTTAVPPKPSSASPSAPLPADGAAPQPQSDAQTAANAVSRGAGSVHNPPASPGKPVNSGASVGGSTPVAKQPHQRKPRDSKAAARRKLALPSGEGPQTSDGGAGTTPQPDFTPLTPTPDQSDAVHAAAGSDNPLASSYETMPASGGDVPGGGMPSLPPLHLSKAQHRSVRTDDGEEVHVLVSPVRSQGGDDSPSSPSRLPDSVLKAMCNMGKAFLSRYQNTTPRPPMSLSLPSLPYHLPPCLPRPLPLHLPLPLPLPCPCPSQEAVINSTACACAWLSTQEATHRSHNLSLSVQVKLSKYHIRSTAIWVTN